MIDRFLRYSMEHGRKIAVMLQDEKGIRRVNITVTRTDENTVYFITARGKKEKPLSRRCILSAAYARGDDGDSLKNENVQNTQNQKI
ncbi:MAG: hypothetical protein IJ214_02110 [Clostridia bacterium]|nr:hypothetical protein [Clostridia bacterium]